MNADRVFDSEGKPRPKPYIFERASRVDGLSVEEARMLRFPDAKGRAKRYSGDLAYDVVNMSPPAGSASMRCKLVRRRRGRPWRT